MNSPANGALAGAIAVWNELVRDSSRHEHNAVRRAMADVVRAWPGDASRV